MSPLDESCDVVVVGGGLAGLSAAEQIGRLSDLRVVVLEAQERLGGRVFSEAAEGGWLNFGAHVLPGPDSALGQFITSLGVPITPIPGSLMGVAYRDRLLYSGPPALYPLRLNISLSSRLAIVGWGARTWLDLRRARHAGAGTPSNPLLARGGILDADETYASRLTGLPRDALRIVEAAAMRSGGDPGQLTVGAARDQFAMTFSGRRSLLANGIVGGTSRIIDALVPRCRAQVRRGRAVQAIWHDPATGRLFVQCANGERLSTRQVILATRADDIARIDTELPEDIRERLGRIPYGPYTVAAFVTAPIRTFAPDLYALLVADPNGPNMAFHLSNLLGESAGHEHVQSFTVYASARRAREIDHLDDAAVLRTFTATVDRYLPGFAASVQRAEVRRWPAGLPILDRPAARALSGLSAAQGDVTLAGDYLSGSGGLEAAFASGRAAADRVLGLLRGSGDPYG